MKYQFKDGPLIDGTLEQIKAVGAALGLPVDLDESKMYNSESKGLVLLSEMDANHLKYACIKILRGRVDSLRDSVGKLTSAKFVEKFTGLADDPELEKLFVELSIR